MQEMIMITPYLLTEFQEPIMQFGAFQEIKGEIQQNIKKGTAMALYTPRRTCGPKTGPE
jgi:hypothetical protein